SSFYESYIWQETILRETLSTVSALQYSTDTGNPVAVVSKTEELDKLIFCEYCGVQSITCDPYPNCPIVIWWDPSSCRNVINSSKVECNACVTKTSKPCYKYYHQNYFKDQLNRAGNTFYATAKPVDYKGFYGAAFARLSSKEAQFAIGPYDGGYTLRPPSPPPRPPSWNVNVNWNINRYNPDSGFGLNAVTILASSLSVNNNYGVESALNTFNKALDILHTVNSVVSLGGNVLSTWAGDPVNMVTGNMYHHETDLNLPARGMPVVFKRSYNSLAREDGPLGYGWTHSFNHYLLFLDDDANGKVDTIVWSDGMDG
ncbi:hypothetical protein H0A36_29625, partial [Endozoicomonas sp. SM1973]